MATELACPVDFITVNEKKVRLTAFYAFLLASGFIFFPHWSIAAFLSIDFLLRGFNLGKYSVLNKFSAVAVQAFNISSKPVDQAPKRFAAKIGFIFSVAILGLILLQYNTAAISLALVLAVFAFLESFLGICAGCYAYTFYLKLLSKSKKMALN